MKPTILVVDDEADIRGLLRVLLQRAGYTVEEVATGSEVQAAVARHAPALVLLDVMLPGLDGHDVCRLLKADPASRHIPVVMQTALRGRTEELRALGAGADGFLSKPIDRAELLAQVAAHLQTWPQEHGRTRGRQLEPAAPARVDLATEAATIPDPLGAAPMTGDRETTTVRHDLDAVLRAMHSSTDFLVRQLEGTLGRDCTRVLLQVRADAFRARQLLARLGDR